MNKLFKMFFLSIGLLLGSCAFIPISSMIKLSTFDDKDFLAIQPEQVKTRITLKGDAQLAIQNVELALGFEFANVKKAEYRFELEHMTTETLDIESGLFTDAAVYYQYEFQFSPASIEEFKTFQQEFVYFGKPEKYQWTIYYSLIKWPPENEKLRIDMEIKFSEDEDYFYLLKDAKVDVNFEPPK